MSSRSIIRAIKKEAQKAIADRTPEVNASQQIPLVRKTAETYSRPRQAFVKGPGPTEHYSPNSAYRDLKQGERALRRKCIYCGDTHLAIVNPHTGGVECRVCGSQYHVLQRPSR